MSNPPMSYRYTTYFENKKERNSGDYGLSSPVSQKTRQPKQCSTSIYRRMLLFPPLKPQKVVMPSMVGDLPAAPIPLHAGEERAFRPTTSAPPRHIATEVYDPAAPVAYQVALVPGIGQFREFEFPRVHTRIHS